MAKPFSILRSQLSPESQSRAKEKARLIMEEIEASPERYCFTDSAGYVQFIFEVDKKDDYYINGRVLEVTSWSSPSQEPSETELYLSATLKWDGCCHVYFGDEDDGMPSGYLHLCGVDSWQLHCDMMKWLFKLASVLILRFDQSEKWED